MQCAAQQFRKIDRLIPFPDSTEAPKTGFARTKNLYDFFMNRKNF